MPVYVAAIALAVYLRSWLPVMLIGDCRRGDGVTGAAWANITGISQILDRQTNRFFMRIAFTGPADATPASRERALAVPIESRVLARAVKMYLEGRVMLNGRRRSFFDGQLNDCWPVSGRCRICLPSH